MADPKVVKAILRIGAKRGVPRKYIKAALETGIVESGLQNLPGGDADSKGWRQERASLYADPTNLRASINRFYDEAAQHDQGQPAGQLAAAVQRPAAQFRGRYGQVAAEASAILHGHADTTGQQQGQTTQTTVNSLLKFGQDKLIDKQTFDKAAFEQARKRALVGAFISKRRPGSVLAEVLPTQAPDPRDFIQTSSVFKPGKFGIDNRKQTTTTPAAGVPKTGSKVKVFDGKPVVAAFIPELQWARQHGWTGTVTSGVRTKAQQLAAAKNFGLQHYGPKGPLGSNHVVGHQGAVDVSEPDQLDAILRHYPGKRRLRRGMADDPVHFSPTGH